MEDNGILIIKERACSVCGQNGSLKRWVIHFSYNRKTRVCCFCIEKLGGPENTATWLAARAIYHPITGKLIAFKKEKVGVEVS